MDKSTNYLSEYVSSRGISLHNMAQKLGMSYDSLYNSLGKRTNKRPLRGDEFLAVCSFIGLDPKIVMKEVE